MYPLNAIEPIDYLMIGHITRDFTPEGPRIGGTATYSSLTARALGLRVGIVTSWKADLPLGPITDIPTVNLPAEYTTTFEHIPTSEGRILKIKHRAENLDLNLIPEPWRNSPIVHLGPVAQEVEPTLVRHFSSSLIGLTPQGWLRTWGKEGVVHPTEWPEASFVLQKAGAVVISLEDVDEDEKIIEEMASCSQVLAVTENSRGVRLYWHGDVRRFSALDVEEVDATGAGDVFATAFFTRLYTTRDPWESARFASQLASISVTRPGLDGIPTPEEVQDCMIEVF
ncbi:MAG: PfkB family carbohydrate kinase [Anaerolineales bacterium]|jgi:sugar/nucleoside kinase (ribokinase family)